MLNPPLCSHEKICWASNQVLRLDKPLNPFFPVRFTVLNMYDVMWHLKDFNLLRCLYVNVLKILSHHLEMSELDYITSSTYNNNNNNNKNIDSLFLLYLFRLLIACQNRVHSFKNKQTKFEDLYGKVILRTLEDVIVY